MSFETILQFDLDRWHYNVIVIIEFVVPPQTAWLRVKVYFFRFTNQFDLCDSFFGLGRYEREAGARR